MNQTRICLLAGLLCVAAPVLAESERREHVGFDAVVFAVPGSLELVRGDQFEVLIEAEAEDLERIATRVSGHELSVRWQQGMLGMWSGDPEGSIAVRVTLPALTRLEVAGSGDVEAGSWSTESLRVEVNGSGSVRFGELATEELIVELAGSGDIRVADLDAALARIEVRGSGDVELAGAADRQEIEVMGSGDVVAAELEGARVEVEVMGSGDVSVWATEHLSAEIMGSGDISYRGSASVEREEHGSGSVRQM
jgi:hypothetical protein